MGRRPIAGGGTNFSIANSLGTGRLDLFQAGAFARHTVGTAYISAALAYGWLDVTTDRTVTVAGVDRLRAEFNANAWSDRIDMRLLPIQQRGPECPFPDSQETRKPGVSDGSPIGPRTIFEAFIR